MRNLIALALVAFAAAFAFSGSAQAADRCGSGAFAAEATTILIMPCPNGGKAVYRAGVPGQSQLIAKGLIALEGGAGKNCLWIKSLRPTRATDKFLNKPVTAKYVALPGSGVLRASGKVIFKSNDYIVGLELKPGACAGRTIGKSLNEVLAMR